MRVYVPELNHEGIIVGFTNLLNYKEYRPGVVCYIGTHHMIRVWVKFNEGREHTFIVIIETNQKPKGMDYRMEILALPLTINQIDSIQQAVNNLTNISHDSNLNPNAGLLTSV